MVFFRIVGRKQADSQFSHCFEKKDMNDIGTADNYAAGLVDTFVYNNGTLNMHCTEPSSAFESDVLNEIETHSITPVLYTIETLDMDAYEPLRFITDFALPKRFYRTFWRSIASRILELKMQ